MVIHHHHHHLCRCPLPHFSSPPFPKTLHFNLPANIIINMISHYPPEYHHHHLDDKQVSPSLLPPRSALDVLPQSLSAYPGSSTFFNQVSPTILILICLNQDLYVIITICLHLLLFNIVPWSPWFPRSSLRPFLCLSCHRRSSCSCCSRRC